jgi:hypothetical protein
MGGLHLVQRGLAECQRKLPKSECATSLNLGLIHCLLCSLCCVPLWHSVLFAAVMDGIHRPTLVPSSLLGREGLYFPPPFPSFSSSFPFPIRVLSLLQFRFPLFVTYFLLLVLYFIPSRSDFDSHTELDSFPVSFICFIPNFTLELVSGLNSP